MSYVVGAPTKRHPCLNVEGCRVFADSQSKKTLERRYHAGLVTKITKKPENAVTMQVWFSARRIKPKDAVTMQVWFPAGRIKPKDAVTMQVWLLTRRNELKDAVTMQVF